MSGGGSAGYSELKTHQLVAHSLMMLGKDPDGRLWDGSNPDNGAVAVTELNAAGTGYSAGDILYIDAGNDDAIIRVDTVDAGAVSTYTVVNPGSNYAVATGAATVKITGSGNDDFTVNITVVGDTVYLGGAYADGPSVMRFIIEKGLTDVNGNPYEGVSGYSPDSDLMEVTSALAALKSNIDALSAATDFGADITSAETAANGVVDALDVASLVSTVLTSALASASAAIADSLADSHTSVKTVVDDALSRADGASTATVAVAANNATAQALSIFDDVLAKAGTATSTNPVIDGLMSLAMTIVRQGAHDVIRDAFMDAISLTDGGMVDDAVDAYEQDTLPEYLQNVNRLASGMADVNAVQTSTFIIGMAILGGRRQSDVNKHRSDLRLDMYRNIFQGFLTVDTALMQQYLTTYAQEKASNLGLVDALVQLFQGLSNAQLQTVQSYFGTEAQMVGNASAGWNNMYEGDRAGYLNSVVNARLQESNQRMNAIVAGAGEIGQRRDRKLGYENAYDMLLAEVMKTKIITKNEEYERNLTYDVQEANWDLDLFTKAGNILSAVNGSVVPNPDRPSKTQTALSVALGVGSIAATLMAPNPATIGTAVTAAESVANVGGFAPRSINV